MSTSRILCLHGYHGSAAVLRRQMGPLAARFPSDVELVLVDAPTLSSGDFDLAIMVGGFTSTLPQHAHLFGRKLAVPSLHATGCRDGIVPIRDSLALADRFADPVIIEHGGGHVIPDNPAIATRIVEFVARHAGVKSGGLAHG